MAIKVDVLLATYNGSAYLSDQIDSILRQSHENWRIIIGDDGSSDDSWSIIEHYRQLHPECIACYRGESNLGPAGNFSRLLGLADADYVMFSDQDDVWLPDKISNTLRHLLNLEGQHGKEAPLLVHTDAAVADVHLNIIDPSLWHYQNTDPTRSELNRVLTQNCATGCTMMINRALCERAYPVPDGAIMHDWWMAMVAAAFGKISALQEATVLYRQHDANVYGARNFLALANGGLAGLGRAYAKDRDQLVKMARQAEVFLAFYKPLLTEGQRDMLAAYIRLYRVNPWHRGYLRLKYGFFYSGWLRNLARLALG